MDIKYHEGPGARLPTVWLTWAGRQLHTYDTPSPNPEEAYSEVQRAPLIDPLMRLRGFMPSKLILIMEYQDKNQAFLGRGGRAGESTMAEAE